MRRLVLTFCAVLLSSAAAPRLQQNSWPGVISVYADPTVYILELKKTAGMEMSDVFWAHAHAGMPEASSVTLGLAAWNNSNNEKAVESMTDIQVRWFVKGSPVSDWLPTPFTFKLFADNPALPALDGIFDINVDVRGTGKPNYVPQPMFLHLFRGRPVDPESPICSRDMMYDHYAFTWGSGCRYLKYADVKLTGRPADSTVTPWTGPPHLEPGLYQEQLAPHTDLFTPTQMWWEEPYDGMNAGLPFARALIPKWDEDHRGLRRPVNQDRLPFMDGPRGIGWASTYSMGQIDSKGTFVFVEAGGPLRKMTADGTITTLAGWRVKPGKLPVWVAKTLEQIRHGQQFEGNWISGRYPDPVGYPDGFRTPLDVAIDPRNESIYYVAGWEDHTIWKADCTTHPINPCQISVFAGDPNHSKGFVNGRGTAARFNGPASLVFDPVCDCLYVADQDNDAIRKITRDGQVSTVFGSPGQDKRQVSRGVTTTDQYAIQAANRDAAGARYARGPNASVPLETYLPQSIRVDSRGQIILLDIGFGAIRRIDPATLSAVHLNDVKQRFEKNDEVGAMRGFAFLDVDRWGRSGPLDGIYYGAFQASWCNGETEQHPNEAYCWMPKEGAPAHFVFPRDWDPYPAGWGPRERTDPPHYFWGMVVDPRGALLLMGGGEHGFTRIRKQRVGDSDIKDDNEALRYEKGTLVWRYGCGGTAPNGRYWPTPITRNGSEGHSYLGLPDPTDFKKATDAQIIQAFGLNENNCSDSQRADMVFFLKKNAWSVPPPATTDKR